MKIHIDTNEILSEFEIRKRHPFTSFTEATYQELGWYDYVAPPTPLTPEQIQQQLTFAVQQHLDETARLRGYDDVKSVCTYVGDPDPVFNAEGVAYRNWRSAVWRYCYNVLNDVQNSLRAIPTKEELIAELPAFVAP